MISVIVVFPRQEEGKSIKNLLVRNDIEVIAACTTAAQVVNLIDDLDYGIIVSGYKFVDMMYSELLDCLPNTFSMLLVASKRYYAECNVSDIVCLSMPIKAMDLVNTVHLMYDKAYYQMKKNKSKLVVRSEEEKQVISHAKLMLIQQKGMTEEEAHKYLQKKSMDSSTNIVEIAHMILDVF